ncbi:MAG: hypothetical protein KBT87_00920 [Gammaproteobacteria bacterium]|nr:hypothetical protein [Gammaproteobacteria bacterium]MBQ0773215.1 hypothetical protein [Gammaproteobacteria bacterium]
MPFPVCGRLGSWALFFAENDVEPLVIKALGASKSSAIMAATFYVVTNPTDGLVIM